MNPKLTTYARIFGNPFDAELSALLDEMVERGVLRRSYMRDYYYPTRELPLELVAGGGSVLRPADR